MMNLMNPANPVSPLNPMNPTNPASPLNPIWNEEEQEVKTEVKHETDNSCKDNCISQLKAFSIFGVFIITLLAFWLLCKRRL
jgi:hypothetical protein